MQAVTCCMKKRHGIVLTYFKRRLHIKSIVLEVKCRVRNRKWKNLFPVASQSQRFSINNEFLFAVVVNALGNVL